MGQICAHCLRSPALIGSERLCECVCACAYMCEFIPADVNSLAIFSADQLDERVWSPGVRASSWKQELDQWVYQLCFSQCEYVCMCFFVCEGKRLNLAYSDLCLFVCCISVSLGLVSEVMLIHLRQSKHQVPPFHLIHANKFLLCFS